MHILLAPFLLVLLFQAQLCVLAVKLVEEGDGTITGYSGTIFTAHNYRPICGVLARGQFTADFDVGDACQPAMDQYRDTNDTWSLYSLTGVRLSDTLQIGRDTELCMCFSLADLDGRKANLCIYVAKDGTTSDAFNNGIYMWIGRAIAVSSFKLGNKALPACYDIDYEAVTSSLDAVGDATRAQIQASSTSTTRTSATSTVSTTSTSSSPTSTTSQTTTPQPSSHEDSPVTPPPNPNPTVTITSENATSQPRSSKAGPGGLYVWLPMLLIALTAIAVYFLRKYYKLNKDKNETRRLEAENEKARLDMERNKVLGSPSPPYSNRGSDWA